ncbi:hypothetical protein BDV93DRAFT_556926 [Ceratobasidium sp. AG-I]|nr:hypothetical protein BDV93DRAFT_556926 [Ceratobasidium sp. AG-I]
MPSKDRLRKQSQRQTDAAAGGFKPCQHCGRHCSLYRGAWKVHEGKCRKQKQGPEIVIPRIASSPPSSSLDGESSDTMEIDNDWEEQAHEGTYQAKKNADQVETPATEPTSPQELDEGIVPPLEDTQVWIRRHPASNMPSGLLDPALDSLGSKTTNNNIRRLPAYFPFQTLDDFVQAEIFCDFGVTDKHIDRQLAFSTGTTMNNAKDYHAILACAARLRGEFISQVVVTEFDGSFFEHYVHYQPVLPALAEIISDLELSQYMVYYPEERHVYRPGTGNGSMKVREELWHGETWWKLQDQIAPNQCILYLVVYIDETNVSTIGGVKVWPIYLWIGNLPASVRRRRRKKGGAILIGYLPKAKNNSTVSDLADFRCKVYHDALNVVFESLKLAARNGVPMRCGDGIIRDFVPVVAAGSADYMEFIRFVCILGAKSGFPCPICLVPRLEQSSLLKSWPNRTVVLTEDLLERVEQAATAAVKSEILHEQSLRNIRSAFFDLIPPFHSIYSAIVADPLHQIEQGVWGKHLWLWIRNSLSKQQKKTLDARFRAVQRYPDLKHFPNGVTALEYVTGKEHAIILRMLPPLIEDLIAKKYQKLVLRSFRALAVIHVLAKLTTHNDVTLEELDQHIAEFDKLHEELAATFDVEANYPKFHSLSHLTDIIRRHSTTDNYHTGLGEALHPQSKKDYRHSNGQLNFEVQMLRMYQERESIMRIRASVDMADVLEDEEAEESAWSGPRVHLGSPDREGRRLATRFVSHHSSIDPGAGQMERHLRTFLYQKVGGFGNRVHFRQSDLPLLDGMLVSVFQLVTIGYISMLDSRDGLDVARVTESWRNQGPRHDFVLAEDKGGLFVGQLIRLFKLEARGQLHSIAYIHRLKIGRRSRTTGYIELIDEGVRNFIFTDSIVRSCVVLSPDIGGSRRVLWDLEGSDMYLRLQDLP